MNMQWDAETYGRDFSFVHRYGDGVAALIGAAPGSTVLDLGCGNGALTHRLRQSGFQVMGLDASPDLLSAARKSYPDIEFVLEDAVDFSLPEPVDVVFSNAVFHFPGGICAAVCASHPPARGRRAGELDPDVFKRAV